MGFHLRRLLEDPNDNDTTALCATKCRLTNETTYCNGYCGRFNLPPPQKHTHLNKVLITSLVLSATFLLVFCYAMYRKFCSSSSRTRRHDQQTNDTTTTTTTHEQFLDEEHGPVLDHPIWYINTIGLQPSVINSISVVKYKKGDGLIEGTDCSVCLNEFQEDETLRLLPKCSHAFHINCIDTWLRSHTNCPLCRAPIVANSSRASLTDGHSESSSSGEETQIEVVETAVEDGGDQRVSEDQIEVGVFPIRRSVSLDSLSAFKISQDMASVCEVKDGEFDIEIDRKRDGNVSNQRLVKSRASSSIGRSLQIGPSSMERSISCGAKLFLARYSRNSSNSMLPP